MLSDTLTGSRLAHAVYREGATRRAASRGDVRPRSYAWATVAEHSTSAPAADRCEGQR